jgi:hypothetical protein
VSPKFFQYLFQFHSLGAPYYLSKECS